MCTRATSQGGGGRFLFPSFPPCYLEYSTMDNEITMKMKVTCKGWQTKSTGALSLISSCCQTSSRHSLGSSFVCWWARNQGSCILGKCLALSCNLHLFSVSSSFSSFADTGLTLCSRVAQNHLTLQNELQPTTLFQPPECEDYNKYVMSHLASPNLF